MRRALSVIVVLAGFAGAAPAQILPPPIITLPPLPLPTIPPLPTGNQTTCKMRGPAWVLYGLHAPNGPARHGNRYLVHAWGITCKRAKRYLRHFFPRIPAHPMGTLKGGPKGFTCKGRDPVGTVTKSKPHDGS